MNRASGSICSRSPGRQKKRHSNSKPAGASATCARTFGRPDRGRKFVIAPSAFSTASSSILPRSPARMIGTGAAGACSSRNPVAVRSPASAARRKSTVSETLLSGRSKGIPFQPSTIRSELAPMPRRSARRWHRRAPPPAGRAAPGRAGTPRRRRCRAVPSRSTRSPGERREAVGAVGLTAPDVGVARRLGPLDVLRVVAKRQPGERQRQAPASLDGGFRRAPPYPLDRLALRWTSRG